MSFQNEICDKCGTNKFAGWCKLCQIVKRNFTNWTSENEKIDNLIQEMQLKIDNANNIVFEWIPYNQFSDIKEIGKGGFATVYSAIWMDCPRESNYKVALKCLHNSQHITNGFLNEV